MHKKRSKYQSIGLLSFLDNWVSGGISEFDRHKLFEKVSSGSGIDRVSFSKQLYSLKQSGFIKYSDGHGIVLTGKGIKRINFLNLEKLSLLNKKRDGLWRLIIFDIPETKVRNRKILRNKLVEFECYQLQKSVYVTPYICEKEVGELINLLDVSKYVQIILAKSLGSMESKVRRFFR